jgi:hypothetical protein
VEEGKPMDCALLAKQELEFAIECAKQGRYRFYLEIVDNFSPKILRIGKLHLFLG